MPTNVDDYRIDKHGVRVAFERAAARYDEVAVLQREVGQRLAQRLDLIKLAPQGILDAGCGTGLGAAALRTRYPQARLLALDLAPAMLQLTRARLRDWRVWRAAPGLICGDVECLPLADASVDLVFSNLTLQWCALDRAFAEFRRVLRPNGLVMFTSFGPDTLKELRDSWARADDHTHVNAFIDMHDIGDALQRAGFGGTVMDAETFTLTYADVRGVMRDLKTLGAHNVTLGRARGLTGKGKLQAMTAAYEALRTPQGVLPARYEVVYGHAWAAERAQATDGVTRVAWPVRRPK